MDKSKTFYVVGIGQGGGRIAKRFSDAGYPTVAINTAKQDLDSLGLPDDRKMHLAAGEGGAGKDILFGKSVFEKFRHGILDFVTGKFDLDASKAKDPEAYLKNPPQFMIAVGGGGGTGTGGVDVLTTLLRNEIRLDIAVLFTLPLENEGLRAQENAKLKLDVLRKMVGKEIKQMILVDNNRAKGLLGDRRIGMLSFWPKINDPIIEVFDAFNVLTTKSSPIESMDPTDYLSVINAGGLIGFGKTTVPKEVVGDRASIANALTTNFERGLLVQNIDMATAKAAGIILCGNEEVLDSIPMDNLHYTKRELQKMMGCDILHSGVYVDADSVGLDIFTIAGGLKIPKWPIKDDLYGE